MKALPAEPEEVSRSGRVLEEPLAESAPLMAEMALSLCAADSQTEVSCLPYHAVCQYLRHLDLMKTLSGQAGFFVDSFRSLARGGEHPRVLVSGSADYSMPAHVLNGYETERAVLDLSLVDRCETPLAITRWYAERLGATVATIHDSILGLGGEGRYDLIVTSAFLGYFKAEKRPGLFAKWGELLRPGGKLIFNQAVSSAARTFSAEETAVLKDKVRAELGSRAPIPAWNTAAVVALAAAYASWRHNSPTPEETIPDLLNRGGFDIDQLKPVSVVGRPGISGPGTTGSSKGLQVIATRR